jgi:hypothetical protein
VLGKTRITGNRFCLTVKGLGYVHKVCQDLDFLDSRVHRTPQRVKRLLPEAQFLYTDGQYKESRYNLVNKDHDLVV